MNKICPIAIYLPQFHPIPENDVAWGKGFTEWTNVKRAKPLFDGHYQPHIPHESVGYYDLRDPEVLIKQANIAKKYGIFGFAFYHYWFNGKRLLERPLDNMLNSGSPDFPFLYIWANEPWSKRWDGSENNVIQPQRYSYKDDYEHIQFLCRNIFRDKRYITIDGKPVFIVYRTELLPDVKKTSEIWRKEAKSLGYKDLFLVRVENFNSDINPFDIGFDASMEFAPDWGCTNYKNSNVHDYYLTAEKMSLKADKDFPWFRCVFPGWDNTPRSLNGSMYFINNTPEIFKQFLFRTIKYSERTLQENSRFIFINAWNEWGEGCHIEADKKNEYKYLQSVKDALDQSSDDNIIDYIKFLERNVKIKSDIIRELEYLRIKMYNSKGHKYMEKILRIRRKIIRFFTLKVI